MMTLSNALGSLVVTTGNKSELSVGYATLYGDMNGGFNPIKDVYKTEVYRLCELRNRWRPPGGKGPGPPRIPGAPTVTARPIPARSRGPVRTEESEQSNGSRSLLRQVQDQARDQRRAADHDEERAPGDRGQVPGLRDEDVQNRSRELAALGLRRCGRSPSLSVWDGIGLYWTGTHNM